MIFCEVLKDNKDEYITFNVNVSYLGYHSTTKGDAKMCAHGCTVTPPIT